MKAMLVNAALVLLGLAPWVISRGTDLYAARLGCTLDSSVVHPCLHGGANIGHALYAWGMAWVYLIVTVPLSMTLLVVYNIFRRRRAPQVRPTGAAG